LAFKFAECVHVSLRHQIAEVATCHKSHKCVKRTESKSQSHRRLGHCFVRGADRGISYLL
jgi:hypothetical protein